MKGRKTSKRETEKSQDWVEYVNTSIVTAIRGVFDSASRFYDRRGPRKHLRGLNYYDKKYYSSDWPSNQNPHTHLDLKPSDRKKS